VKHGDLKLFQTGLNLVTRKGSSFLKENNSEKYNLIDVRTPRNTNRVTFRGTIDSGGELADRLSELDPRKTTVVY